MQKLLAQRLSQWTRTPLAQVRFLQNWKFWNKIFESRIWKIFRHFIFWISSYSEIQPNRDAHSFWLILIIMIWNQYYWMIMFYLVLCLFTNAQINWKYQNIIPQCQESFSKIWLKIYIGEVIGETVFLENSSNRQFLSFGALHRPIGWTLIQNKAFN